MGRFVKTKIDFPTPLEMGSAQPLDARLVVEQKDDLRNIETWAHSSSESTGQTNVYQGMQVYVLAEKETYTFVGADTSVASVTTLDNWSKNFTEGDIEGDITDLENELEKVEIAAFNGSEGFDKDLQQPYKADATKRIISGANSLYNADQKLNDEIEHVITAAFDDNYNKTNGTYKPYVPPTASTNSYISGATSIQNGLELLDDKVVKNRIDIGNLTQIVHQVSGLALTSVTLTSQDQSVGVTKTTGTNAVSFDLSVPQYKFLPSGGTFADADANVVFKRDETNKEIRANIETYDCGEYVGTDRTV